MPSDRLILGFDTSAAHCAAALLSDDGRLLARRSEEMGRGQAERLMGLLEELLAGAGADWSALDAIGVGTGPGNFTGIRIAVAAARGLALSLGRPAIGVSGFEVIDHRRGEAHLAVIPAPRDQFYVRAPGGEPALMSRVEAEAVALPLAHLPAPAEQAETIARIAAARRDRPLPAPVPLYVLAADAAPPRDPAPRILGHDA